MSANVKNTVTSNSGKQRQVPKYNINLALAEPMYDAVEIARRSGPHLCRSEWIRQAIGEKLDRDLRTFGGEEPEGVTFNGIKFVPDESVPPGVMVAVDPAPKGGYSIGFRTVPKSKLIIDEDCGFPAEAGAHRQAIIDDVQVLVPAAWKREAE